MSSARHRGADRASPSSAASSSASSPTRTPRTPRLAIPRDARPLLPRSPSALLFPPAPAPPPLHITIRFSIALPDLHLDIPLPQQTTVVALKHLIRGRLAAAAEAEAEAETESEDDTKDETSSSSDEEGDNDTKEELPQKPKKHSPAAQASLARLRFIHNGRILPDAAALSAVLKAPPPPPLSARSDSKGKSPAGIQQQQRVFINCSIGDPLPASDITAEAAAATAPPALSPSPSPIPSSLGSKSGSTPPHLSVNTNLGPAPLSTPTSTTDRDRERASAPLGFDRLTQAGLTPSEISTLRSHFRAIHTSRFAPDTMPSPDTLRAMEDAWLDGGSHLPTTATSSSPYGSNLNNNGDGEGGETGGGGVDDVFGLAAVAGPLIQGMLVGFVFPLGVIGWLGKEEGVWSRRMQVFVVFGVLLSVSVGWVRGLTGEG
ncbi:DUF2407 C-terminal domain-containing protein [Chaetomium sp. MPI-SDFR-AT-0129]|nr:DUF2407 C-terminal domain-containing protein [Chaetomium sp. MPI-SDFR-AT-0129]